MALIWTKELSVGNAVIDSDHKRLMELVNDIAHVAKTRDSFAMLRAIKLFRLGINRHFINEEQFAQMLDFPFAPHKLAHQNMRVELDFTEHELSQGGIEITRVMEHYADFLRGWLIKHITEEDMQMKPALQSHPYGFKNIADQK